MKVGIIAAMDEELSLLVEKLENREMTKYGSLTLYQGTLCGLEIGLMLSGIGKVNAAVATTMMLDKFSPKYIINTGVAGGFGDVAVGDICVATELRHHDADVTAFNYEMGQIPKMPAAFTVSENLLSLVKKVKNSAKLHYGPIMSGDSFIHDSAQTEKILKNFPEICAVEMESAAIAQTCYLFQVPFLILRAISDRVEDDKSKDTYSLSMEEAAENSIHCVLELLQQVALSANSGMGEMGSCWNQGDVVESHPA